MNVAEELTASPFGMVPLQPLGTYTPSPNRLWSLRVSGTAMPRPSGWLFHMPSSSAFTVDFAVASPDLAP